MTIQRQYSLPNCTLVVQGLGDSGAFSATEARPQLSTLFNAECHLAGLPQPLSGGREFLDSLVYAVSDYAQEILSGIQRGAHSDRGSVHLERIDSDHHRLTITPPSATTGADSAAQPAPQSIDLSTVQVFDLMEAVDQLLADSQTLPDLTLKPFDNLKPLSKRYVRTGEPLVKQAAPAALGASGVALAAAALFALPVPKVNEPANLTSQPATTTATTGASPAASPPVVTPSPETSPSPTPPQTVAAADLAKLETVLTTAPEIKDAAQLQTLQKQLYDKVDQAWKGRSEIPQDLVYRVGVNKDGTIVGYKPVNPAALTYSKQTPLLNLLSLSAATSRAASDPIGQFKVIFTPSGVVDVAPWQQAMATSTAGSTTEITNAEQLKELQPKLYDKIDQTWKAKPSFEKDLVYRVRVKADGSIADYRPENQPAADYVQELPLPQLGKPAADGNEPTSEPLALFKVVFKPDGKLEISPWRGVSDAKTP